MDGIEMIGAINPTRGQGPFRNVDHPRESDKTGLYKKWF